MKKTIILSLFIAVVYIGCSSGPDFIPDQKQVQFITNGIWLGVFPCEDCEEIDYQLNLKDDFTFKERSVYKGKDGDALTDEGSWAFESDSVIVLNGSDEDKLYLIGSKNLIRLNEYGERFEASVESKYMLKKDLSTVKKIDGSVTNDKDQPMKEKVELNPEFYQKKFVDGVDFFGRGNEPNWTIELDLEKNFVFSMMDGWTVTAPSVEGIKNQDLTLYRSKSESGELIITVIRENCQDNMSGEIFPYKVRVEAKKSADEKFQTFEGCGKFLADLRLYDIWVMEEMTGINLKKEKLQKGAPQFEFILSDMRFNGHAGCNSFSGSITVSGDKITFGSLLGTLMSCQNMKVEKAVVSALDQKTVTYSIDKMKLTLVSGKTKMVFKKVD
ncbi:MAG: META domain-containing protein [Ignavibacteriota bacterium]|jgi:heat shock protein HslJ/uncharacterized membrane protein|nr:META domain-containing protein [Ignavibacterium album]MCZ2270123.1 META domain-containing protein [Ignavibacteriales bacterium]MDD5609080.1 META domain-containing protein [Ignavibacterium sp.]MDX9713639.1 META domain-containing protein [Ignavibacteriaceae bacterium]QKK00569.1 MAG: META domain-containing protein [Ignavibacteriota bacterium]